MGTDPLHLGQWFHQLYQLGVLLPPLAPLPSPRGNPLTALRKGMSKVVPRKPNAMGKKPLGVGRGAVSYDAGGGQRG